MEKGKFNVILDAQHGSSGKGKMSAYLADRFQADHVSSANFPNAGHSVVKCGTKFIAKAIPTAAYLNKHNQPLTSWISPGSAFFLPQLLKEWRECGHPEIRIHDRIPIVDESHAAREREGSESTAHIASTMQGSATALVDKILRKKDMRLTGNINFNEEFSKLIEDKTELRDFVRTVRVLEAAEFRYCFHDALKKGERWLHEGSQGYALSIDHGNEWPATTSRNCTVQAAMDYMAAPPKSVGDIYLNVRSYPIRVGHLVENGVKKGDSGSFYSDQQEITWEEVGKRAGMPEDEINKLAERERTTVTKRIRRCADFSYIGLKDAVEANGATKLIVNFIQYINWKDNGLKGGHKEFRKLSTESKDFIRKIEDAAGIPVVLVGTGEDHDDIIDLL